MKPPKLNISFGQTFSYIFNFLHRNRSISLRCQHLFYFLKVFKNLFILAVLGLHCCTGFSLVTVSRGYSLVAVHVLLIGWLLLL